MKSPLLELKGIIARVFAVEGEEFFMGTGFDDFTAFEDENSIGAADGGEAVGDNENGTVDGDSF